MRYQAEPVPGLIQSGRINTKNQVRELNAIPLKNASSEEKVFIEKAIEIIALFDQAFDVEDKILKNLNSSAALYMSNASDDEIGGQIDEINVEFIRLVDERADLMQRRLTLLQ